MREVGQGRGRLSRWARGCLVAAAALLLVFAASLIGFSPAREVEIVREDGTPLAGAYAACFYSGHRFNFVHSVTYERAGRLVRSGPDGRLRIPGRLYRKGPLDTWASPRLLLLYAPELHLARRLWSLTPSRGLGTVGVRDEGRQLLLRDLGGDPDAWERSLEELHSFLSHEVLGPRDSGRTARVDVTASVALVLAGHLRAEVDEFVRRHARTPRRPPPPTPYFASLPPDEQRAISARIEADLAREPLWGPRIARRWAADLDSLDRRLAALQ